MKVKILEIDSERRRLSLSVKRVEDQVLPQPRHRRRRGRRPTIDDELDDVPELGLSEDVFAGAEVTIEDDRAAAVVERRARGGSRGRGGA